MLRHSQYKDQLFNIILISGIYRERIEHYFAWGSLKSRLQNTLSPDFVYGAKRHASSPADCVIGSSFYPSHASYAYLDQFVPSET